MCAHHGTLVDADSKNYPVLLMRKWKREAEARARGEHEGGVKRSRASPTLNPRLICVGTPTTRLSTNLVARMSSQSVKFGLKTIRNEVGRPQLPWLDMFRSSIARPPASKTCDANG